MLCATLGVRSLNEKGGWCSVRKGELREGEYCFCFVKKETKKQVREVQYTAERKFLRFVQHFGDRILSQRNRQDDNNFGETTLCTRMYKSMQNKNVGNNELKSKKEKNVEAKTILLMRGPFCGVYCFDVCVFLRATVRRTFHGI